MSTVLTEVVNKTGTLCTKLQLVLTEKVGSEAAYELCRHGFTNGAKNDVHTFFLQCRISIHQGSTRS